MFHKIIRVKKESVKVAKESRIINTFGDFVFADLKRMQ